MAKTIVINDDGSITCDNYLTNEDKLNVGNFLFEQEEKDNDCQVIFYTGIYCNDED